LDFRVRYDLGRSLPTVSGGWKLFGIKLPALKVRFDFEAAFEAENGGGGGSRNR